MHERSVRTCARAARSLAIRLVLATSVFLSSVALVWAQACIGDCDGDGVVTKSELKVGVNLALESTSQTECASRFDADQSGDVAVNDLIGAVSGALLRCAFKPSEGVLLAGDPMMLAVDATADMPPVGVDESAIQDGVILTRLDLHLAMDATVGEVNAALALVDGGIISMLHGLPTITIAEIA